MTDQIREAAEALIEHCQAVTYANPGTKLSSTTSNAFQQLVEALKPVDSPVQAKLKAMGYAGGEHDEDLDSDG